MDRQELENILRSQAKTFTEDVERKLEYLNSDDVFSEYTRDISDNIDDEFDDDEFEDDDDDEDEDDDDEYDDDDEDDDEVGNNEQENINLDPETIKKQKLAAKIAAMRGLATPQFLKK